MSYLCFFFNDTATTEIYTLSLHDALPICHRIHQDSEVKDSHGSGRTRTQLSESRKRPLVVAHDARSQADRHHVLHHGDRKSTRLNSSHANISYAVFCLKKKKTKLIYRSPS